MKYVAPFGILIAASFLSACASNPTPDYESWKTAHPYGNLKPALSVPAQAAAHSPATAATLPSTAQVDVETPVSAPALTPANVPTPAPYVPLIQPGSFVNSANATSTRPATSPKKVHVDFGYFPKGTTCKAFGTTGEVSVKYGREIEFKIRGDTSQLSFTCQQPDGKSFSVNVGTLVPKVSTRLASIQINQDNNARIFWDDGGLMRRHVPGILQWH